MDEKEKALTNLLLQKLTLGFISIYSQLISPLKGESIFSIYICFELSSR